MKKILTLLFLLILFLTGNAVMARGVNEEYQEIVIPPYPKVERQIGMSWMEERLFNSILIAETKNPDFKAIHDSLSDMKRSASHMKRQKDNKRLKKSLSTLISDISSIQKIALKKDRSQVNTSLTNLMNTCFRCHATHRATKPAKHF